MAKAWGHSRSGIEGLRPDLITSLAGGSVSSLFLLVTKSRCWYRFTLNRLVSLAYLRCVPFWRAPGGTRTHVSGNCWVRLSWRKTIAIQRTGGEQRLPSVFLIVYQASTASLRIKRMPGGAGGLNTTEGPEAPDIELWSSLTSLCFNATYGCLSLF